MTRIFIGLDVPENVERALTRLEYGLADMSWVDPKTFHVTLRFIGDVTDHELDIVKFTLEQIRFNPFKLHLNGVGYFKKRKKCTAIWAGVEETEELMALTEGINAKFDTGINLKKFFSNFKPHITLALPENHTVKDVQSFVDHNHIFAMRDIPITEFHLYESRDTDAGPDYDILETYVAKPPEPVESDAEDV